MVPSNGGVISIQGMENMNTNADNLQVQQVTDDHLERVMQDFNEFRARILKSSSTGAMKLEELVDLYICGGVDGAHSSTVQSTVEVSNNHLEKIAQDFNKFREKILRSSLTNAMKLEELVDLYICSGGDNMDTLTAHDASGQPIAFSNYFESLVPTQGLDSPNGQSTEAQGNEDIIEETADQDASHDLMADNQVTHIRYGDLNFYEAAVRVLGRVLGGDIGLAFGSVARFFNANRTETKMRVKRKYKRRAVQALQGK